MCRQVNKFKLFFAASSFLCFCDIFETFQVEAAKQRNGNMFVFCSPQRSDGEGTVQLDGEGYAAVGRPTRWNPNVSTVTFKFRTFSSEALLMYLATEDMVCIQQSDKAETSGWLLDFKCQCLTTQLLPLLSAEGLYVPGAL